VTEWITAFPTVVLAAFAIVTTILTGAFNRDDPWARRCSASRLFSRNWSVT
jgi:hypothetical protein